jgi:hypothetical protein
MNISIIKLYTPSGASGCRFKPPYDFVNTANLPALQPHLDTVRVCGRARQDLLDYTFCESARGLVSLQDDQHGHSGFEICARVAIHLVSGEGGNVRVQLRLGINAPHVQLLCFIGPVAPVQNAGKFVHPQNLSPGRSRCALPRCFFHRCTVGSRQGKVCSHALVE